MILTAILMLATSCAKGTPETDFCLLAPRITTSILDTEETKLQVDDLWAIADSQGCGW